MADFDELTWQEAMRRGHAALLDSEHLYDDINTSEGRSNLDIENTCDDQRSKPPRPRSGLRWPVSLVARATAMATQAPDRNLQQAVRRSTTGQRPRGAEAPDAPATAFGCEPAILNRPRCTMPSTGCVQPVGSAYRLMARKWAATPAMTSRWNTSW